MGSTAEYDMIADDGDIIESPAYLDACRRAKKHR